MKMAKSFCENVIDDTTMKMANSKMLKINLRYLYCRDLVTYIYVLAAIWSGQSGFQTNGRQPKNKMPHRDNGQLQMQRT